MSLRQVETFAPESGKELLECINYANSRSDGGRTVIELDPSFIYYLDSPIRFGLYSRITLNMNGMTLRSVGDGALIEKR